MNNEQDIELSDINPIVPNEYFKIIKGEMLNIINSICGELNNDLHNCITAFSDENGINSDDFVNKYKFNSASYIDKYMTNINKIGVKFGVKKRNRRILPKDLQCMGRKLDFKQCTRGRIDGTEYCKSHKNKLKYGRIDDELEYKPVKKRGRRKKSINSKNNYVYTNIHKIGGVDYLVETTTNYVFTFDMNNPKFLGIMDNERIIPYELKE